MRRALAAAAAVAALSAGCTGGQEAAPPLPPAASTGEEGVVAFVNDGDTLRLDDGRRVRLLQIDAPEIDECYADESRRALERLAGRGTHIELTRDPSLDERDQHDRLLRYVRADGVEVNVELVARGAAVPYFFRSERGALAGTLLAAVADARDAGRGLWGACPGAELDPGRGSHTGPR